MQAQAEKAMAAAGADFEAAQKAAMEQAQAAMKAAALSKMAQKAAAEQLLKMLKKQPQDLEIISYEKINRIIGTFLSRLFASSAFACGCGCAVKKQR